MSQSIFEYHQVRQQVLGENLSYFKSRASLYSEADFNELFYHACRENCSTIFIDGIIALGIKNLNYGCVKGALFGEKYDLLFHLLTHYGHSHQINLFEIDDSETPYRLGLLMVESRWHDLFELILQSLKNHSQRVKKIYVTYALRDWLNNQYTYLYNYLLGIALGHKEHTHVDDSQAHQTIDKAIAIIARKKFPVMPGHAQSIVKLGLEPLFKNRLSHVVPARPEGLANCILLHHGKLDVYSTMDKKMDLLKELAYEFKIPARMIDLVEGRIMENSDAWGNSITQAQRFLAQGNCARLALNEEDFLFMQSIRNKSRLFNFFYDYFDYERAVLHDRLMKQHDQPFPARVELVEDIIKI